MNITMKIMDDMKKRRFKQLPSPEGYGEPGKVARGAKGEVDFENLRS